MGQAYQFLDEIFLFRLLSLRFVVVVLRAASKSHKRNILVPPLQRLKKRPETKLSCEERRLKNWVSLGTLPLSSYAPISLLFFVLFFSTYELFCSFWAMRPALVRLGYCCPRSWMCDTYTVASPYSTSPSELIPQIVLARSTFAL